MKRHDLSTRLKRLAMRAAIIGAVAFPLGACSTIESFSSLNPFGGEKYKTKLLPDVPGQEIYDQALARLYRKAPTPSSGSRARPRSKG